MAKRLVGQLPRRGVYTLIIRVEEDIRLKIGGLGIRSFPRGFYTYTGSAMGLGGKGFGEAQENIQYRTGLGPITQYVRSLMTRIIAEWYGKPHLQFIWVGLDPKKDELRQAQVD